MKLLITTQVVDRNDPHLGFFHRWVEEFAKHCEKVIVVCLREGEHVLPKNVEVLSLGKHTSTEAYRGLLRIKYSVYFYRYLFSHRYAYERVFVHMNPEYLVLGGLLWRLWRKQSALWYVHKSITLKLRLAVLFANRILTASKESFRLKSDKVKIVGHGIDTVFFSPASHTRGRTLLSVGRLSPSKRHDLVIRTMALVPHATLKIAGEGSEEQNLRALAKSLGVERRVEFLGAKRYRDMPEIYQAADVLVHTSQTGSIDKVVLEALACGLSVISTSEAFMDRALPVRLALSTPERIAAAVEEVLSTPEDPEALAEPVRRLHSLPQCIKRILASYA